MIGRTNVGGGGATSSAWAYIGVSYPSGSTCTATNGTITLSASGTSGSYVFPIPQPTSTPETWTVTCTNGSKTKSTTVSISTQYQVETVILRYSRLPAGYQEVEYIESPNIQTIDFPYIDTGRAFGTYTNQEIEIIYMYLGNGELSSIGGIFSFMYLPTFTSTNSARYRYGSTIEYQGTAVRNQKVTAVFNDSNGNITENGAVLGAVDATDAPATQSVWLYTLNGAGYYAYARIYSYKVKNKTTGNYLEEYVPCYRISDEEPGFYDLANNVFVSNAEPGSEPFTIGPDV